MNRVQFSVFLRDFGSRLLKRETEAGQCEVATIVTEGHRNPIEAFITDPFTPLHAFDRG